MNLYGENNVEKDKRGIKRSKLISRRKLTIYDKAWDRNVAKKTISSTNSWLRKYICNPWWTKLWTSFLYCQVWIVTIGENQNYSSGLKSWRVVLILSNVTHISVRLGFCFTEICYITYMKAYITSFIFLFT